MIFIRANCPEYWGSARQKLLYLLGSVFSFALHFPNLAWRWTFFSKLLHESNKLIDLRFRFFHFASDVPKVIPFIERVRDLICNDIKSPPLGLCTEKRFGPSIFGIKPPQRCNRDNWFNPQCQRPQSFIFSSKPKEFFPAQLRGAQYKRSLSWRSTSLASSPRRKSLASASVILRSSFSFFFLNPS